MRDVRRLQACPLEDRELRPRCYSRDRHAAGRKSLEDLSLARIWSVFVYKECESGEPVTGQAEGWLGADLAP